MSKLKQRNEKRNICTKPTLLFLKIVSYFSYSLHEVWYLSGNNNSTDKKGWNTDSKRTAYITTNTTIQNRQITNANIQVLVSMNYRLLKRLLMVRLMDDYISTSYQRCLRNFSPQICKDGAHRRKLRVDSNLHVNQWP